MVMPYDGQDEEILEMKRQAALADKYQTLAAELAEALSKIIERFKRSVLITGAVPDEDFAELAVKNERAALAKYEKAKKVQPTGEGGVK